MANYATLRGPVGLNRVYASVANGALGSESWLRRCGRGNVRHQRTAARFFRRRQSHRLDPAPRTRAERVL